MSYRRSYMGKVFEVVKTELSRHYVEFHDPWLQFKTEHTNINGRKRIDIGVEMHKSKIHDFLDWLEEQGVNP